MQVSFGKADVSATNLDSLKMKLWSLMSTSLRGRTESPVLGKSWHEFPCSDNPNNSSVIGKIEATCADPQQVV